MGRTMKKLIAILILMIHFQLLALGEYYPKCQIPAVVVAHLCICNSETKRYTRIHEEVLPAVGTDLKFMDSGETLANWNGEGTANLRPLRLWDVNTGKLTGTYIANVIAVSHNNEMIASWTQARYDISPILLRNVKNGKQKLSITKSNQIRISKLLFSQDGKTLISCGTSKDHKQTVELWDTETGNLNITVKTNDYNLKPIAFSADSQVFVSSGNVGIQFWNTTIGEQIFSVKDSPAYFHDFVFSPNESMFAISSSDETIRLWDTKSRKQFAVLIGHTGTISSMAFAPDGDTIATASTDETIRLWNTKTGKHITTLVGHTGMVEKVLYSPDGETLVSASRDKTIRVWNVVTGKHKSTLVGHIGHPSSIAFSPDGKKIASVGKEILLWKIDR